MFAREPLESRARTRLGCRPGWRHANLQVLSARLDAGLSSVMFCWRGLSGRDYLTVLSGKVRESGGHAAANRTLAGTRSDQNMNVILLY
jgi:hypothetical protein